MTYKAVITKPTKNALTETDPNDMIFSSDYNTLKYHLSGEKDVTLNYPDYYDTLVPPIPFPTYYLHKVVDSTVVHGLGYIPFFVAYVNRFPGGTDKYHMCPGAFVDVYYYYFATAYADDDKLHFIIWARNESDTGTLTFNYKYKIFKNNLNI